MRKGEGEETGQGRRWNHHPNRGVASGTGTCCRETPSLIPRAPRVLSLHRDSNHMRPVRCDLCERAPQRKLRPLPGTAHATKKGKKGEGGTVPVPSS